MPTKFKIILLLIVPFFLVGCAQRFQGNQVCLENKCFVVEIAQKQEDLARGLQFRESLKEDHGMLFVFSRPARHTFWMKDTLIALDMIWMDYQRNVIYIAENVQPCKKDPCPSYGPKEGKAVYVLEINAGLSKKLGIKTGSQAEFRLQDI